MDITTEPIIVAMRKGQDDKCEVVDQDSLALLPSCCLSTVASVHEVLWQATATLMLPCQWHGCGVTQVCSSPNITDQQHKDCAVLTVLLLQCRAYIIYLLLAGQVSWLVENFNTGIFSDTINVINVKLSLMVLHIELCLFITFLTLTQGHSSFKQF